MPIATVPFLVAKNANSLGNCLRPMSGALTGLEHMLQLGDSITTINGGAGTTRGHCMAQTLARTYGGLPQTPIFFGRPSIYQQSIGGGAHNVQNNGTRVTTQPPLPANLAALVRPLGAGGVNGLVYYYDPLCVAIPYGADWTAAPATFERYRRVQLMPATTVGIKARIYLCTRPGAGAVDVAQRTYNVESAAISNGGYTAWLSGLNFGQNAAEGSIVTTDIDLPAVNFGETQHHAIMLNTSGTPTDVCGVRFIDTAAKSGMSFDMFGEGGTTTLSYDAGFGNTFGALATLAPPTVVVLSFGTNDCRNGAPSAGNYVTGATSLIAKIRAVWPSMPIHLWMPALTANAGFNTQLDNIVDAAAAMVAGMDDVLLVNVTRRWAAATGVNASRENLTGATAWAAGQTIAVGDRRTYRDATYQALIAHTASTLFAPPYAYWIQINEVKSDELHNSVYGEEMYVNCAIEGLVAEAMRIRPVARSTGGTSITLGPVQNSGGSSLNY